VRLASVRGYPAGQKTAAHEPNGEHERPAGPHEGGSGREPVNDRTLEKIPEPGNVDAGGAERCAPGYPDQREGRSPRSRLPRQDKWHAGADRETGEEREQRGTGW
jgi:hypothetical protein